MTFSTFNPRPRFFRVTMLRGWQQRVAAAVERMGNCDLWGAEATPTHDSYCVCNTAGRMTLGQFRDRLRQELNFDGYMEVDEPSLSFVEKFE